MIASLGISIWARLMFIHVVTELSIRYNDDPKFIILTSSVELRQMLEGMSWERISERRKVRASNGSWGMSYFLSISKTGCDRWDRNWQNIQRTWEDLIVVNSLDLVTLYDWSVAVHWNSNALFHSRIIVPEIEWHSKWSLGRRSALAGDQFWPESSFGRRSSFGLRFSLATCSFKKFQRVKKFFLVGRLFSVIENLILPQRGILSITDSRWMLCPSKFR
jgi:hypothetical protein